MAPTTTQHGDRSAALDALDEIYTQRFDVRFDYPVHFSERCLSVENPALLHALTWRHPHTRPRVLVAVDSGLWQARSELGAELSGYGRAHSEHITLCPEPIVVPGGEAAKNDPELISRLHEALKSQGLDRHATVLAIGGGAVLDAVGFAASTYHRGLRLVRMPSTVLAQNDAGVGVKDGVNRLGIKNFLGTFSPPSAVLNDHDLLGTLLPRDKRAGMAEAVKVALIRDPTFFTWLVEHVDALRTFESSALRTLIRRAATIHLRHIAEAGDPFERGSARPLDFGHWSAHKLESLSQHALRHGEAVAIGMALDTRYSELSGLLSSSERASVISLLDGLGFRLWHPVLSARNAQGKLEVLAGLEEFREHMGGELNIPLLPAIGAVQQVGEIDQTRMEAALAWLEARDKSPCD